MYSVTLDEAKRINKTIKNTSKNLKSTSVVICPPFPYIPSLISKTADSKVFVGAQNIHSELEGAYTGEVSAKMLKEYGVSHVVVGHSERRQMGETDEMISKKVQILLDLGMSPILCVGEKTRDDHGSHLDFLKNQIKNSLNKVSKKNINKLIVAYEPIWAIGAKEAMDPATVYEMSLFVKKVISDIFGHNEAMKTPVLYGGSVNFRNAPDIISKGQVDGLLVGRESVNPIGFVELLKAVDSI